MPSEVFLSNCSIPSFSIIRKNNLAIFNYKISKMLVKDKYLRQMFSKRLNSKARVGAVRISTFVSPNKLPDSKTFNPYSGKWICEDYIISYKS